MIASYHSQAFQNQLQATPWTADQLYDFQLPESTDFTDEGPQKEDSRSACLSGAWEVRDRVLNQLRHLTISSLSSFEEIASTATDLRLASYAEVVVRQRVAHQHALLESVGYSLSEDDDFDDDALATLRSLWRGAIWNLEQHNHGLFIEYAERAESLLEEAYLSAAQMLGDDPVVDELRGYAVMVCGSRALLEELMDGHDWQVPAEFHDVRRESRDEKKADRPASKVSKPLETRSVQKTNPAGRPDSSESKYSKPIRAGKSQDWHRPATTRTKVAAKVRGVPRASGKSTLAGRR